MPEQIKQRVIEDEMKQSYLDYSMSVIVGRALPDVRDGLKPVHRRVLYTMHELGLLHNKPFKKSANIVGNCMAKYHPHGDAAIYDSLVRMAQGFSLRYPLVQGQGNFGSIDGDRAAAMRYTEARLSKLSEEMLQDIEKQTVEFVPNFDNSTKEPSVLPSKVPNLLINGSSGIAVGMATNIPPHNLSEVCSAIIAAVDNPEITIDELIQLVPGPDFPTAGLIMGKQGIKDAYKTGRGKITLRARADVQENKIIITEIPYQVNKSDLVQEIAKLVKDKKVTDVTDLRDESDRKGIRIILELKKSAAPELILKQLYRYSRLETTFGIIMLALVDNRPVVLNIKSLIANFIKFRKEMITKRTQFDLKKAEYRKHIVEGLLIALKNIDNIIKVIRSSKSTEQAIDHLIDNFKLTKKQASAILDMRLQKLTSLEQEKMSKEDSELAKKIEELKSILGSAQKILDIIKQELAELKEKYNGQRMTEISHAVIERDIEEIIKPEDVVITITHSGYIKRMPISSYKRQKRGGKGIIAATTREEDFVEDIFIANTVNDVLFFTDKGIVYSLKVHQIPDTRRQAKGTPIVNLLNIKNQKITESIPVKEFKEKLFLVMATRNGTIKKTELSAFENIRRTGIKAINLDDDSLVNAVLTDGSQKLLMATRNGMAIKFDENDVRPMGRAAAGVRGIKLKSNDEVIGLAIARDEDSLLTVTENGFGKRTKISEYRLIKRGGSGVLNLNITDKNGFVAGVKTVTGEDELMLISQKGIAIRITASDVSQMGRITQGVRIMKLAPGDILTSLAKIAQ